MHDKTAKSDNRLCMQALTARQIEQAPTYNFRGFVGKAYKKGDLYLISEITGNDMIIGHGETIEEAMKSFEEAVLKYLREYSKDSQRKMILRRFTNREKIHAKLQSIYKREVNRRMQRDLR